MKKWIFLSALIVVGFFATGLGEFVKAEDHNLDPIGSQIGWEDGDDNNPVVENDGPDDGAIDYSSDAVSKPKISKISDEVRLYPSGPEEWDN
ncbi:MULTISPECIES: hypothetical protein [Bacillus]|uniref:Secreted protein n=2 Tax=Bacillus TaxID=1386 RepID=A0ABS4D2U9_9BACI|nr:MULTISPECIES: hypothetical protein [Bacillus]MBP1083930.1 hypothetical protein [Bacillus capparidis]MED1097021.1 hypothetical protein [Bacillus capparidis]